MIHSDESERVCQYCGTNLDVEQDMFSQDTLFTKHGCRRSEKQMSDHIDYVSPPIQPDYYNRLEARRIATGKEWKHWRAYSGGQVFSNMDTLIQAMQAGYGQYPATWALKLYQGRN